MLKIQKKLYHKPIEIISHSALISHLFVFVFKEGRKQKKIEKRGKEKKEKNKQYVLHSCTCIT